MGLDMYLTRRAKGQNAEHELLAYWRKANHIHGWFERNTTDGYIENCECYPVCRQDLVCLMDDCRLVKDDRFLAPKLLPVQDGFFFGSFGYGDEYYTDCIDQTISMLERVLEESGEDEELFYHAWW